MKNYRNPNMPLREAEHLLQKIAKARDAVFKARENRECKCSDFCLQYEGSCQCGSHRPVIRAENELQLLLNSIEKEEEEHGQGRYKNHR